MSGVLPCGFTQLGYIEPGHGLKGRTQWLTGDDDFKCMGSKMLCSGVSRLWMTSKVVASQKNRKAGGDTASTKKSKQTASNRFADSQ